MGLGRGLHYFGSFLLLAAAVLLIVTSISAPVVDDISMLTVNLQSATITANRPEVKFGTFGYCVANSVINANNYCTKSAVGYDVTSVLERTVTGIDLDGWAADTVDALTNVMVLHPICAGLAFITFVISLTPGTVGGILAMLATLFTFLVTLVVCVIDFVLFGIIKDQVNDSPGNSNAEWGSASWTTLVALVCLFIATILAFFTCCAGRRQKKRDQAVLKERNDYGHAAPRRRRHFWQRR